jgi:hypothetical protein
MLTNSSTFNYACPGETINPSGSLALPRDGRSITLWNYDVAAFNAGVNLYGSHPFVLQLFQGGSSSRLLSRGVPKGST